METAGCLGASAPGDRATFGRFSFSGLAPAFADALLKVVGNTLQVSHSSTLGTFKQLMRNIVSPDHFLKVEASRNSCEILNLARTHCARNNVTNIRTVHLKSDSLQYCNASQSNGFRNSVIIDALAP